MKPQIRDCSERRRPQNGCSFFSGPQNGCISLRPRKSAVDEPVVKPFFLLFFYSSQPARRSSGSPEKKIRVAGAHPGQNPNQGFSRRSYEARARLTDGDIRHRFSCKQEKKNAEPNERTDARDARVVNRGVGTPPSCRPRPAQRC
jgi:hypothetical protein